ncbi:MAG: DinB family protein [Anaerolineae bacterium]
MVMKQELQIDALKSAMKDVERVVAPLPSVATEKLLDGGWTMVDVVGHLIAVDDIMFRRFQRMMEEDDPDIIGEIPDSIYRGQHVPFASAMDRWRSLRGEICEWLEKLPPGALNRHAQHNERGKISIRTEVQVLVNHDTEHLNQLIKMRENWERKNR